MMSVWQGTVCLRDVMVTDAVEEPTVLSVNEIDPAKTVPDTIVTVLKVAALFEEKSPWMAPPVIDSEDDPERAPP